MPVDRLTKLRRKTIMEGHSVYRSDLKQHSSDFMLKFSKDSISDIIAIAKNNPERFCEIIKPKARRIGFLLRPYIAKFANEIDMTNFVRLMGPNIVDFYLGLGARKNLIFGFPASARENYMIQLFNFTANMPGNKISFFFKGLNENTRRFFQNVDGKEFGEYLLNVHIATSVHDNVGNRLYDAYSHHGSIFLEFAYGIRSNLNDFVIGLGTRIRDFHRALNDEAYEFVNELHQHGFTNTEIRLLTGIDFEK